MNPSSNASTRIPTNNHSRGAFIVLEGVDRCGKTTQASLLVKHLLGIGLATIAMQFPDRSTMVGNLIDQYLQSKSDLDDRAVHLLFSANRWEAAPFLLKTLIDNKTNIVCDRYAHSGLAFSSAKPSLENDLDWCQSCDVGLPAPDAVIFLDLSLEEAENRCGYGGERYEKKEMQKRVRQRFSELQRMDENDADKSTKPSFSWYVVDAAQTIADVQRDINQIVESTIEKIDREEIPIGVLWEK